MSFKSIENDILNHLTKRSTWGAPTEVAIALFYVAATDSAAGTECTGAGYARVAQNNGGTDWNAPTGSGPALIDNVNVIDFPQATADYSGASGDPIQVCIFDAATAGNNEAFSATFTAVDINNGDTPRINAGQLDITCD